MKRKNVVIVGNGFAGSFAAYLLSKNFDVLIIDKNPKSVERKCLRLLTSSFFSINPIFRTESFNRKVIVNKIPKALIVSKHNNVQLNLESPEIVINPKKLRHILLSKAMKNGAKFLKANFSNFSYKNKRLIIALNGKKTLSADFLIDASGAESIISRKLGNKIEVKNAIQAEIMTDKKMQKSLWTAYIDISSKDLVWLFPYKNHLTVSYTSTIPKSKELLSQKFKMILKMLGTKKIFKIEQEKIPIWNKSIIYGQNNVFLLGDSAAQVKATTYGGIVPLFRAAKILESVISKNKNAEEYAKRLSGLSNELKMHALISRALSKISDDDVDFLLELIKKNKKLIGARDELSKNINFFWLLPNLLNLRFLSLLFKAIRA